MISEITKVVGAQSNIKEKSSLISATPLTFAIMACIEDKEKVNSKITPLNVGVVSVLR